MPALLRFLRYVLMEFGALIVFWGALYVAGIKPAIAATIVFIALDGCYRWWRKLPVTRLYVLTSALAVGFGCIDLMVATPFMIKFEAVIINIALGIFFVAGARGEKSPIQEVAEKRAEFPDRADVRYFFRGLTLAWAAYFFVKAAVYLWIGAILPLEQALALRTVVGGASLACMFGISLAGRPLFLLCRRLGMLPAVEEPAQPTLGQPAADRS